MHPKVAVEEGVLFGAGKIIQYQKMIAKDDARTYFLPNAEAMSVVSKVAAMVSSQTVELGGVGTEYVGMQEYMEALSWPKDTDSGLRQATRSAARCFVECGGTCSVGFFVRVAACKDTVVFLFAANQTPGGCIRLVCFSLVSLALLRAASYLGQFCSALFMLRIYIVG